MRKLLVGKSALVAAIAVTVLLALALPSLAFPQGCSLCYTQAANSGARFIRALRNGIVVLIIPPLSMCIGAMVVAYRRRNRFHQTSHSTETEEASDW